MDRAAALARLQAALKRIFLMVKPARQTSIFLPLYENGDLLVSSCSDDDERIEKAAEVHGGIQFKASQYSALQGYENVELQVERTGGGQGEVAIHYLTMDG
jgi:hypothetical protein